MSVPMLENGKIYLVYGKKGAGKSIYLASCAYYAQSRRGGCRPVYANFDCKNCYPLPDEYWHYAYPVGSVLLIDEIALIHRNRDFKSFSKDVSGWYKMLRKMGLTLVMCSQIDDVDKTIRSSADYVIRLRTKYQFGKYSVSVADKWVNTLVCSPQVNSDGVAVGAAEIAMGLSRMGSRFKSLYLQFNWKYYSMYDTKEMFVDLLPLPDDLPAAAYYAHQKRISHTLNSTKFLG